ncbi:thymidine phosphorylase [Kangiella profundi]|uniref:Putative thymidine phosphorylase n=1 Tax=Kangiella profundi TaxID=1561924 RepID=A0A2K9AR39_9GAMM|nr:thymidine phosphorylase family protein [Kangiella profundi]AUD78883.1 thymidine phosphorylase [Kangiella profundi]GGF03316.1 putative thymidine phosphorylase [Kangiella profundi]
MDKTESILPVALRLGINSRHEPLIFLRSDSPVARSEGFESMSRVLVQVNNKSIIATLLIVYSDLIQSGFAGLSETAWKRLKLKKGQRIKLSHAPQVDSLAYIRAKAFGHELNKHQLQEIMRDIVDGHYMDVHLAAFITACANNNMTQNEILYLTQGMVDAGETLTWPGDKIVDKHCVGGLPGNRTSPIVVSILAAKGLTIPKTSSRAITSPAGTADVMETMTKVDLSFEQLKQVVQKHHGCLAWGGSVSLSPADDILISVEKALDIDFEGQLIASILSKKIAAGSKYVLIDIPVGPTAKLRSEESAQALANQLTTVGGEMGLKVKVVLTDGSQPVGYGIGPALEAWDVIGVLKNASSAPADLKERSVLLAGVLLEHAEVEATGEGKSEALRVIESGEAWKTFMQICEAQGGFKHPPVACCKMDVHAERSGYIRRINNRLLSRLAKLAGAPADHASGVYMEAKVGHYITEGSTLLTIHSEAPGELEYALDFYNTHKEMIIIEEGL